MKTVNLLNFSIAIFTLVLVEPDVRATCKIKESTATAGGYRELQIGKYKLIDVDSFKETDEKIFYATSPVYGKPEIGVIYCNNNKYVQLVAPKNIDRSYPNGTDFFRLKEIIKDKKTNSYTVWYFYAPDVDSQNFNNLENKKNLKSVKFPNEK